MLRSIARLSCCLIALAAGFAPLPSQELAEVASTILVKPVWPADLPKSVRERSDELLQPTVALLRERFGEVPVVLWSKDLPHGADGWAAGVVEAQVLCSYATYLERGAHELEAVMNAAVPEALALRLVGRRGYQVDPAVDCVLSATREAPAEIRGSTTPAANAAAQALIEEIVAQLPEQVPEVDAPTVAAAIAAEPLDPAQAPTYRLAYRARLIEEQRGREMPVRMPPPTARFQRDLIGLVARRMAPVHIVEEGAADGTVAVTVEIRCESVVENSGIGGEAHPRDGTHDLQAELDYSEVIQTMNRRRNIADPLLHVFERTVDDAIKTLQ